jgi:HSP20 family protein
MLHDVQPNIHKLKRIDYGGSDMLWQNSGRRSFWRDFDRLQREMNRIVNDFAPGTSGNFPPINVWAGEESVFLTAELPGVEPDQLDVSIVGDSVTLSGERSAQQSGDNGGDQGVKYHRQERWQGSFSRSMQLPFRIDAENVEANFRNGVLEIRLPRAAEDKPRKISVSTGQTA